VFRCTTNRWAIGACAIAILLLLAPPAAWADEPAGAAPTDRDWDATIFGYGWLSSVKADISTGPVTAELDESIVDLVPMLTWAIAGGVEARYQRFLFGLDALGQQIQTTERAPAQTFALDPLGAPFAGLTGTRAASSASIRSTEVMAEAAAGWRALWTPVSTLFSSVPSDDPRHLWLDLLGGARYWYWRTEVRLSIPPVTINSPAPPALPPGLRGALAGRVLSRLALPRSIQLGGSNAVLEDVSSWTDAIIGVRVGGDVLRDVSIQLRTDIGGFGFGDSSKFTWQVMPTVQWRFADNWVAAFNWRAIGFSHANVDNAILYGALVGIGYRF